MIKLIFEAEEGAGLNTVALTTFREHSNVATGAKAAGFRLVVNPYSFDRVI